MLDTTIYLFKIISDFNDFSYFDAVKKRGSLCNKKELDRLDIRTILLRFLMLVIIAEI